MGIFIESRIENLQIMLDGKGDKMSEQQQSIA
jgi:hypothetical protein